MIYQGEEDPALYGGQGPSIVDYLAGVIGCRKRLAALSRGAADYQSVQASDGVFACLRSAGDERAIVLMSMYSAEVRTSLTLPAALNAVASWKDELTGEQVNTAGVPMVNHQVRVLTPLR